MHFAPLSLCCLVWAGRRIRARRAWRGIAWHLRQHHLVKLARRGICRQIGVLRLRQTLCNKRRQREIMRRGNAWRCRKGYAFGQGIKPFGVRRKRSGWGKAQGQRGVSFDRIVR